MLENRMDSFLTRVKYYNSKGNLEFVEYEELTVVNATKEDYRQLIEQNQSLNRIHAGRITHELMSVVYLDPKFP